MTPQEKGWKMYNIAGLLQSIATAAGVLLLFAALILFAMQKLSDTQGGRGEAALTGCVIGAISCGAAAAFIAANAGSLNVIP